MKKCKCGSYAVNIERFTGENCDVCHYKNQVEALIAERDALLADLNIKQTLLNESRADVQRQEMSIEKLLAEREAMMKQEPAWYSHCVEISPPEKEDIYLVDYLVAGLHQKMHTVQAMIHFHQNHGWRSKITPCFVGDIPKDSKYAVSNMIAFKPIFGANNPLPEQQKDNCQICKGAKGGVIGNENVIDGKTVCDFCHADESYKLPSQQIQYQAACSGLWYENPKACGDIAAIKVDGEIYELSKHMQYSKAFSDGFKAGKEGDEDLLAHVLMHGEPARITKNFLIEQISKSAEETKHWPEWRKDAAKTDDRFAIGQAQQIPEGYALVPIEPTKMMTEAMEYEAAGFDWPEPYWQNILAAASASQPKGDM